MPQIYLQDSELERRFRALDAFLIDHAALWRPRPFTQRHLPWEDTHPALASWLRSRTLAQAEAEHNAPHAISAPSPFPEWAAEAQALAAVGPLPSRHLEPVSHRYAVDVPGRKWLQVQAFAKHTVFSAKPVRWVDWCAGKGHLGRLLGSQGAPLTALEHDEALVTAGQALSNRLGLADAQHLRQDVMAPEAATHLGRDRTPVALHACGDLHVTLLRQSAATGSPSLAVAPCCYNRIEAEHYSPLSRMAQASRLLLDRDDLGLPLTETVTAGERVRKQRDASMARRLAFDSLQRTLRGRDEYLPTPSLPTQWLQRPLSEYCMHLGALKGLPVPEDMDWPALEAMGWQRLAEVRNLELVRALFRRPLELWLLLDRALYLQEHGYTVRLGAFCEPELTPRNLMLLAERPIPMG
ncbi:methyltransferase [Pseudomonas sp. Marseille-QA0892]